MRPEDTELCEKPEPKAKRQPKPICGLYIVWRFKGDRCWLTGYLKETLAKGKILWITDSEWSSHGGHKVHVEDIDWYRP